MTLSNIRLLRANRILKLDCDRIVEEQTSELKEEISHLLSQNVRLQRSNRLLQDDLNETMVIYLNIYISTQFTYVLFLVSLLYIN